MNAVARARREVRTAGPIHGRAVRSRRRWRKVPRFTVAWHSHHRGEALRPENRLGYALALVSGLAVLFAAGCGSGEVTPQNTQSSAAAHGTTVPQPSSSPTPSPADAAPKSASATQHQTLDSGYTCSVEVTIWNRLPESVQAPVAHPADADATIDPTSDYDPTTDVVIPFEFTLTNTTKSFDLQDPKLVYGFVSSVQEANRSLDKPRTLDSWDWYDSGWDVTGWTVDVQTDQSGSGNPIHVVSAKPPEYVYPSMSWSTSLAPGDSVSHVGFFVYHDTRTPVEPSGSAWTLKYLAVHALYWDETYFGYLDSIQTAAGDVASLRKLRMRGPSLTGESGQFYLAE